MIKSLSNHFSGLVLLLVSSTASASFTASATLEFLDCGCNVRSRHTLMVEFSSDYDKAVQPQVSTYECPFPGFPCGVWLSWSHLGQLTPDNEILGGSKWGIIGMKTGLYFPYSVNMRYCAKTQNSLFGTYLLKDETGNTNALPVYMDVEHCGKPTTAGQNCGAPPP